LADSGLPEIKFSFFVESDKIAHAGIYFIFVFLLTRSWVHHFANKAVLFLIISSFMQTISFGIVMEVLQKLLTQSREFDMNDIYANTGGTVAGLFFYYLMYRFGFQATSDKLTQ
jgi:glycopeptide antibiotics resistance protein